jgi:hypothetical protein
VFPVRYGMSFVLCSCMKRKHWLNPAVMFVVTTRRYEQLRRVNSARNSTVLRIFSFPLFVP